MRLFIRAKSWQLMFIFVVVPIVGLLLLVATIRPTFGSTIIDYAMLAATIWINALVIAWIYSIVVFFHYTNKLAVSSSIRLFKYLIVYIIFILLANSIFTVFPIADEKIIELMGIPSLVLFLAQIISYLYIGLFVAKTVVILELKTKIKLIDYIGTFFLFVFFPIGIWYLQPRINNLFQN